MNDQIESVRQYLKSQTGRLALTYLVIIMAMTLLFSIVIYHIASSQFDRPLSPQFDSRINFVHRQQFEQIFQERARQARGGLIISLSVLNLVSLALGSVLSYILARKTLGPIESALTSQKQFVSDASHELRTPLTALQTTNEVALRKKKLSLAEAKELMKYNIIEVIKLQELTNSLLGLVKQESASVSRQEIDIKDIISDVLYKFTTIAQGRNIAINDTTRHISLYASGISVGQVLTILLDNAIKYSSDSSVITVSSDETNDEARINVIDRGIGVEKNEQAKIFDRFYRVEQSRSGDVSEGAGLGLAIAKAICERQGMYLTLESKKNKGSTFTLHIKKH